MFLRLLVSRCLVVLPGLMTFGAGAWLAACSSSPSTTGPTPAPDAGTPVEAGPDAAGPLTVTPSTAKVLTCDTLQFKQTGGAGDGSWSVTPASGAGTVDQTGDYSAPTKAPMSPAVSVNYTEGTQSASGKMQVATAFVGKPSALAVGTNGNLGNVPFDHQFTASGSQVYGAVLGQDFLTVDMFASSDSGSTFAAQTSYHTGDISCATVAVDVGNPQVVYLVYLAGHGDSTSNTGATVRLAVSADGAKTFPTEYVIADSINGIANMICPDVISPSAGHVLVLGGVFNGGVGNSPAHVGAWVSSKQGVGIGPVGQKGVCSQCPVDGSAYYAPSDTNGPSTQTMYPIAANGDGYSPRAGTNGKGAVCMVYQYNGGNSPSPTEVQCSQDNGGTWTAPIMITAPTADAKIHPTIAVSPTGKVAVAWIDTVATAIQSFIALSTDGGKTFGAPIQYPALPVSNFNVADPVVAWENDEILWISETADVGNAYTIFVDKTCDDGKTWSGAVQVSVLQGTSLLKTAAGMVVGGYGTQPPTLSAISLNAP